MASNRKTEIREIKIYFLSCITVFFVSITGFCDNISISASVDKNSVQVGEQINLQITVSGDTSNIPEPALPPLSNFTVYSSGRSQNVSIISGKVSSSVAFNYVIVPNTSGKLTIGPARVHLGSQEYRTQPIEINVSAAAPAQVPAQPTPHASGQPQQVAPAPGQQRADLFVEASVDKKTAYVNEQITYSFRFYRRINLLSQPQYQPPSTTGFLVEDLPPHRNYYTDINGIRYLVTEVKTALFGASAGRLTIGPAVLRCAVADENIDDFFARFFSQGRQVALQTEPVSVNILELPAEGKPLEFSGAVGRFSINSSADKSSLETGEALTLSISISGTGNVKTITEPKFEVENFRRYDTAASLNVEKKNFIVSGSKVFKIVLIPTTAGHYVIPAVKYSYFEPSSSSYKIISSHPIPLNIKQGKVSTLPMPQKGESAKAVVQDIRHIKKKFKGPLVQKPWKADAFFYILQFIPAAGFILFWRHNIYRERLLTDISFMRLTRSFKVASKRLKHLQNQKDASEMDTERFCSELFDILTNYFGDKLNISSEGMTRDFLAEELTRKGCVKDLIDETKALWEEISFCRYAPGTIDAGKVNSLAERTAQLIRSMERHNWIIR
ncbi:MAG: BatD family protein [Elusimicrobiota bacterium]